MGTVAVVGAGTMGSSIALAAASAGFSVVLKDVDEQALASGLSRVRSKLQSLVRKDLAQTDADRYLGAISTTTGYAFSPGTSFVIEAVSEDLKVKEMVFKELDRVVPANVILATNTSSLFITRIAAFTRRPDRVIGLHFFNPAHIMKLVEVVPGVHTSEDTIGASIRLVEQLGKHAVRVEECPSFLVNRLLTRYMNEAIWCLQESAAGIEEIDSAASDYAMPVGPLALRDMSGSDIGLAVAQNSYEEYGERFRPPELLRHMVEANMLGRKSGKGFYTYDAQSGRRMGANPEIRRWVDQAAGRSNGHARLFSARRLFLPMIGEAFVVLQEKIVRPDELDPALKEGLGMRKGPLELAQDMGLSTCLAHMQDCFKIYGERFRPPLLLKRLVFAGRTRVM